MSQQELDISDLLEYTSDIRFISACYQTLLKRTINPGELRYAVQMLENGLSKKGFIYWICRSPEFGGRYTIKSINSYRLSCYVYKGYEKLAKLLHLEKRLKNIPNNIGPQTTDSICGFTTASFVHAGYDFETEFSALSCGQISLFSSLLHKETADKHWTVSGYLASDMLSSSSNYQYNKPENLIDNLAACTDNTLVTSPELIFQLLTNHTMHSLTRHVKDTFIFTMPVLPHAAGGLSVIWDTGWGGYESTDGVYSRWLKGLYNQSSILILNSSPNYRKISISFTLMCPYSNALIVMKAADTVTEISLKKTLCDVCFEIQLNPGCNKITFQYCGSHYVPEGDWARSAKFAVSNLTLTDTVSSDNEVSGLEAYQLNEEEQGTGYYPYLLPDAFIRSQLHSNGFFDVQAYSISQTYAVNKLKRTRFYYPAAERDRDCYYTIESGQTDTIPKQFSSLTIYIAHRTSPFMRDSVQDIAATEG